MSTRTTTPFSPRIVLGMLLFGAMAFLLTLYFIGADETGGGTNDGGGHAGGKGLNGYAAMASLLGKGGYHVTLSRNEGDLSSYGLLVLTPPHGADGQELAEIVARRRHAGPTLVILPKWYASSLPAEQKNAKKGWVALYGSGSPEWKGFADDIAVTISRAKGWQGGGLTGPLPDAKQNQSGTGSRIIPLVRTSDGSRVLAGYVADEGTYPALNAMAGIDPGYGGQNDNIHPLIFVFEPDLLDNFGMADRANALLASKLIRAASETAEGDVVFDLTQNGLGRSMNLLTLAFTPPFLAATLCLVIAAIVVTWRAFRRFGPPLTESRAIAFGKRQLVENSAGFIRRTRRLHLLGPPYAALMRKRIAHALGLRWRDDGHAMDEDIGRALAARHHTGTPFHALTEKLGHARSQHELLRTAEELKQIERMLGK
ncbi:hypothetical protein MB02_01860 [Croceicoccus estronivorus]|uniref:DUF4350 domain-containing protein n=1 Tax=Croceicoccus estronivorus TaxID=1172626 RepID=UPI0008367B5E|nr:DUF4350 domain-containing protein [Croceicoccus estronivorus]OCC25421.1 hypothetical protein MB02_01860 [Croceicoccus estronivorus]